MSRDQAYGGVIFIVALLVAIGYIIAFFAPYIGLPLWWREWAIALPMFLLVVAALVILMWIGWTMLTTPPPLPIEGELEAESTAGSEGSMGEGGEKAEED